VIRPKRKTLWRFGLTCLLIAIFLALGLSKPVRIRYHKWRLIAAKQEYLRLARGEYRFSDKMRELFLGRTLTWAEVEADWKKHEDALVQLGLLRRVDYYPRRGNVPSRADPGFAAAIQKMDAACPCWSYRASKSEDGFTVTATKECLELWKSLAASVGLQPNKPKPDDRRCGGKGRRRSRSRLQPDNPPSVEWSALLGDPAKPAR
jgi:hypothetical protein